MAGRIPKQPRMSRREVLKGGAAAAAAGAAGAGTFFGLRKK